MKVLVNGIGNIGTTLLNILNDYKDLFGIDEVYGLKNSQIKAWNSADINLLKSNGVKICTKSNDDDYINFDEIKNQINYIFDTNANTFGLKNKEWYANLPNLIACSAQGSEKGFGVSFMSGTKDIIAQNQKFMHIVSCNTHAIASIINTISQNNISEIKEADFVIVRRSEDLGNHQRLVSANVVSRHRSNEFGTHHAIDAIDLFKTMSKQVPLITSSDITTPSQLMHTVRFNIKLHKLSSIDMIIERISLNPYASDTSKFDSNIIFELGRRYSPYGRIYSHAIFNSNNLLIDKSSNSVKGWAFIPQEGNTIISTLVSFLYQTSNRNKESIIEKIQKELIFKEW